MKKTISLFMVVVFTVAMLGCATHNSNQQSGMVYGAAGGAAVGALIGGDWLGALIGAGAGLVLGGVIGSAIDQETERKAKIEAARSNERVVYYTEDRNQAVESTPMASTRTNCTKVRTKIIDNGKVIKDVIEEVCKGSKSTNTY
jgi:uncharacterized protein YcfJ